ncbi:MAG TPA: SpoIIE family protein phosphatase [Anaerolineales bacterium]
MEDNLYEELRAALQEKQANLSEWLEQAPEAEKRVRLGAAAKADVEQQLETIETALDHIHTGTLGICEVCHGMVDEDLLQMDYTACVCLDHYSEAERRALESELELTQNLQRALLPRQAPVIPGLDIAAFSRPAQIVTGDYFDFVEFKDGLPGLVIADVSGHGVSAGMLMTSLQTAFQTLAPEASSPFEVLQRLNRLYIHNINLTTFVTVFFAKFDPRTHGLSYANAGHPAYLYRADTNEDLWLRRTGPAIGLVEEYPFGTTDLTLNPGDILVLYTDGLTEAMDPDQRQYGDQAVAEVVRKYKDAPARTLVNEIIGSLTSHISGSGLADDVTLLVTKSV